LDQDHIAEDFTEEELMSKDKNSREDLLEQHKKLIGLNIVAYTLFGNITNDIHHKFDEI
jgi:hypothetical protein